jgi:dipeptidyl aminopeptidase/acylaminoacyl peptidase
MKTRIVALSIFVLTVIVAFVPTYSQTTSQVREAGNLVIDNIPDIPKEVSDRMNQYQNVRGSSGYGKTYLTLDNGFKREESVKDIGALLDWIAQQPELDKDRVAVYGGSYGGYMVLASMTHFNDRLAAAVDVVGISNFVTFLENTQEYRRDLRRVEYGDERDPKMREFLTRISPTTNANKITKPLFVVQGANDPRVPAGESQQIVDTVRKNGGQVWYLLAKDEGHGFQKKSNRDYYLNAMSMFWEKFLLKEEGTY